MTNFEFLLLAALLVATTLGFQVQVPPPQSRHGRANVGTSNGNNHLLRAVVKTNGDETVSTIPFFAKLEDEAGSSSSSKTAKSLQEKMSNWEASEAEIKAATLGGVTPGGLGGGGRKKNDGFDVGLYIAFPFMILGSLLFAFFPLIMDKIDVSSVGPPPMM